MIIYKNIVSRVRTRVNEKDACVRENHLTVSVKPRFTLEFTSDIMRPSSLLSPYGSSDAQFYSCNIAEVFSEA